MTGLVFGVAMMISSTGVSPALETSRGIVVPAAFTFDLPDEPSTSRVSAHRLLDAPSRSAWQREPSPSVPRRSASRFSKTERIIAVAAGFSVGWIVGGGIGGKLTESSNPNDDTSVLKGIIIGAPIGAAVGAILGWRLTK